MNVRIPSDYNQGNQMSLLEIPNGAYSQAAIIHGFRDGHEEGWTGEGIKIGIADSGDSIHQDVFKPEKMLWADSYTDGIDKIGHGTQVRSLGAMRPDNKKGYIGAAYGCTFVTSKVLSINGGSSFDLAAEIRDLVDQGCDVINMSLGIEGIDDDPDVSAAIQYGHDKGATFVAAAGNANGNRLAYPASNKLVFAAKAVDINMVHASFSNLSGINDHDDCFAGVGVRVPAASRGGGYSTPSGTSFSGPLVAYVIALFKQMFKAYFNRMPTRLEVKTYLVRTALDIDEKGPDRKTGYGLARFMPMTKEQLEDIFKLPEQNICTEVSTVEATALDNFRNPRNIFHRIAARFILV